MRAMARRVWGLMMVLGLGTCLAHSVCCLAEEVSRQQPAAKMDLCQLRMANLGKQRGARCRDALTQTEQGPELVVINTAGLPAFAIGRYEISVNDFNRYCRLYRRCALLPASALPITNIDLQQAMFYLQWLTRTTGFVYRLPTLQEWQAAASGDSGMVDHNCVVNRSGRILRGNGLRAVDQGYANNLGLLNLFGNAEEWVRDGDRVVLAGGDVTTDITRCNAHYQNETSPEAAGPFRGLRVVRELK